jgi:hypothetical protein
MASIWLFAGIFLFTSIGANINAMAFASIQGACCIYFLLNPYVASLYIRRIIFPNECA